MARVTVEDCLERVENRFALVILASKRTKELKRGAPLMVHDRDNREVVMALREIARRQIQAVYLAREPQSQWDLNAVLEAAGVPLTRVSPSELLSISGSPNHQGL